jgi:hypothetical protein
MFNSEANNVLHGRSDGANLRLILDDLLENESTFESKINSVLEEYPTATEVEKFKIEQRLKKQFKLQAIEVEKLVKAHSAPINLGFPTWMDGKSFLEQQSDSDKFLYPELLIAGRVNLLVGVAGAGKSSFAFDMAASWALDLPFLHEMPSRAIKPKIIIFVNSDQPFSDFLAYCRKNPKIVECARLGKLQTFGKTHKDATAFTLPQFVEFQKNITSLSQEYEILMVVDSLSGLNRHNNAFSDSDSDAATAISLFQALCDRTGATTLMIHHAVKDTFAQGIKKCRGNSRIAEEASSLMIIEQIKDEQSKKVVAGYLEIPKMRGCTPGKRDLIHDNDLHNYDLKIGLKQQDIDRLNVAQSDILDILNKIPGDHEISYLMRHFSIGNKANANLINHAFNRLIMRGYVKTRFDVGQNQTTYSLIP